METIAVFGGSFDPPTLAHEAIIRSALTDLSASRGIVIPCADEYIRCMKGFEPAFTAETRVRMLRAAFSRDESITVDTRETEINSPSGRSLLTMRELKSENPGAEFIFVTGADKLRTLPKWGGGLFIKEFRIAVYPRRGESIGVLPENVTLLNAAEGIWGISAGAARAAISAGGDLSRLLSPEVIRIIGEVL